MKGLVLIGEGKGDVSALPILLRKLLKEREEPPSLYVDKPVIRCSASQVIKWDKSRNQPDHSE